MSSRWLRLAFVLVLALTPTLPVHAQDECQDLMDQRDQANQQLDQLKQDAQGWLAQAGQFAQTVPPELLIAAQQDEFPFLTPDLAATDGGLAALLGAQIDTWREANDQQPSGSYLHDLAGQLLQWHSTLATLAPVQSASTGLLLLNTALGELDQNAAGAAADQALVDSFTTAVQACQAAQQNPPDSSAAGGPEGAVCSVGGQAAFSNSDCFNLELNAAFDVWQTCTEAYFAAEREAFRTGGDLPINTCDPAYAAAQQAIQDRWGAPSP